MLHSPSSRPHPKSVKTDGQHIIFKLAWNHFSNKVSQEVSPRILIVSYYSKHFISKTEMATIEVVIIIPHETPFRQCALYLNSREPCNIRQNVDTYKYITILFFSCACWHYSKMWTVTLKISHGNQLFHTYSQNILRMKNLVYSTIFLKRCNKTWH